MKAMKTMKNVKTMMNIADGFGPVLERSGLGCFEEVMAREAPPSQVTRAVPGRFTTRIELETTESGGLVSVLYLKRYHGRGRGRAAAAAHEWGRLHEVAAAGIPCPQPVALGERRGLFSITESFLMTAEIKDAAQADWWISENRSRKSDLVAALGALARGFHGADFHHQDFYLCHFFVREGVGGGLELFLIDLQRCGRILGRRRWLVKDLAQLHHSMENTGFSRSDWEQFLHHYGGIDPAMSRAVLSKSSRIARHIPKYG